MRRVTLDYQNHAESTWHKGLLTTRVGDYATCRSASIGFIAAARRAGYRPKMTPTATEMPNATGIDQVSTIGSTVRTVSGSDRITSGKSCVTHQRRLSTNGWQAKPPAMPVAPPQTDSRIVSMMMDII